MNESLQERHSIEGSHDHDLYTHLGDLARYLGETMRELATLDHPLAVSAGQLPRVSKTLTELTSMTERGTHQVMALTEDLLISHRQFRAGLETIQIGLSDTGQEYIGVRAQVFGLMELAENNQKALMGIMTALSFQDLAGQRIANVVMVLDEIQARLLELVVVFGVKQAPRYGGSDRVESLLKELEQAKQTALKQDVADDLLREFGF